MTRPPLQAVLFDYGNVLSVVHHDRLWSQLGALCGWTAAEAQQAFRGSPVPKAYESGALDTPGFLAELRRWARPGATEAQLIRAFNDIFSPIEGTRALVRRLHGRVRLGLVSNTNALHADHEIRANPVLGCFETLALSHEVGAMKPDPRLYFAALEPLGVAPEAAAFIDDLPEFVEAARSLGLHGIQFTGPEALEAALKALGAPL